MDNNNPDVHSPCPRCGNKSKAMTCSRFNTEWICIECDKKERAHPEYKRASEAELEAVRAGNYNFKGIGKPADL